LKRSDDFTANLERGVRFFLGAIRTHSSPHKKKGRGGGGWGDHDYVDRNLSKDFESRKPQSSGGRTGGTPCALFQMECVPGEKGR